ncbi:AraC-like DNA-binding protein [Nocardioides sp. BE266]|uniref:helix-turn-helix domain-containing protein n=1 Tax=Nocardioides sp. BE266 TaxID=2817725 RepID=UPI002864BA2C|nr:helix-turn-helix domain-containing protein [Nocardioides sp. BE266]MDR7253114.1 AraC-like DNA-binding protein [Nocardioides sp. BE266]
MTRDPLRELLDAVLADDDGAAVGVEEMAARAFTSPTHFARVVRRRTGEPPATLRRRVLLERAAWLLRQGRSVTDVAWDSGFDSLEGFSRSFSRSFGIAPSRAGELAAHRLPAPSGIHFHAPAALWVDAEPTEASMDLTAVLVEHDLADTTALLDLAAEAPDASLRTAAVSGLTPAAFDDADLSPAVLLRTQVHTKEVWLAAIDGTDFPDLGTAEVAALRQRHDEVAPRWRSFVADTAQRGGWGDTVVDALCEPPQSFTLGGIVAHVLTHAAHRRALVRHSLDPRLEQGNGDPITWLETRP